MAHESWKDNPTGIAAGFHSVNPDLSPPAAPSATSGQDGEKIDWAELGRSVHWMNLLNPRMWIWAFVMAILASIPIGLIYAPAVNVVAPLVFIVALLATALMPGHCPECGKAIKIGYSRCRACGLDVDGT